MMKSKLANQWLAARLYILEVAELCRENEETRTADDLEIVAEHIKKCIIAEDPHADGFGMTRLSRPPQSIDHAFTWSNTGISDSMARAESKLRRSIARFFS